MNITITINKIEYSGYWNKKIYFMKGKKNYIYIEGQKIIISKEIENQLYEMTREGTTSQEIQDARYQFIIQADLKKLELVRNPKTNVISRVINTWTNSNGFNQCLCDSRRTNTKDIEKYIRFEIESLRRQNNNYTIPSFYQFDGRYIHENNKCWYECWSFGTEKIYSIHENLSFNKISEIFINEFNTRKYINFKYGDCEFLKIQ